MNVPTSQERARGRIAPTPSGALHLGNALAFGAAWLSARAARGELLLRIEDVDTVRAQPSLTRAIVDDLEWLGLTTDSRSPDQSTRRYETYLEPLRSTTYYCRCTRRQLTDRACACRDLDLTSGALRFRLPAGDVLFTDRALGTQRIDPSQLFNDPILIRSDGLVAYPLAVVADDIASGVSEVVRGDDLLTHTAIQIRIYEALDATPPTWLHTPTLLGDDGKKLSKSHGSESIAALRDAGWSPEDVWRTLLPFLGIEACDSLHEAIARFDPLRIVRGPITIRSARCPR